MTRRQVWHTYKAYIEGIHIRHKTYIGGERVPKVTRRQVWMCESRLMEMLTRNAVVVVHAGKEHNSSSKCVRYHQGNGCVATSNYYTQGMGEGRGGRAGMERVSVV